MWIFAAGKGTEETTLLDKEGDFSLKVSPHGRMSFRILNTEVAARNFQQWEAGKWLHVSAAVENKGAGRTQICLMQGRLEPVCTIANGLFKSTGKSNFKVALKPSVFTVGSVSFLEYARALPEGLN